MNVRSWHVGHVADPESGVDWALGVSSLMLGLFSVATLVAIGYLNYTKLPWFDAWNHWGLYLRNGFSWTFLFSQHNEHRIPVGRLLYLADQVLSSADTRFLLWSIFLAQAGSALILYRLTCSSAAVLPVYRIYILGVILAFAFAASQLINFTMTFQIVFVVVFFAAFAAFAALKNSAARRGTTRARPALWLATSIVMGLMATGSMANGLLVWPLMVLMAVCLGLPKRMTIVVAVVGVLVIFAYMHDYQSRDPVIVYNRWTKTPEVVAFAFAYLGSAFDESFVAATKALGLDWDAYRVPLCALAGVIGVGWFFQSVMLTLRERARRTPERIALLHILAFIVASGALTAVGRVQYPIKDALTSRYVTPSLLFWACLIASAVSAVAAERRAGEPARDYGLRVAVLVTAAFVGGLIQLPKVAYAADAERFLAEGEYALINNVFVPEGWLRFLGSASGPMIPVVRYFREHHLASFSSEWTRWLGDPLNAHFRPAVSDSDCVGAWESVSPTGGSFNPAVLAAGWGYDRRFKGTPERVVFADRSGRIIGFAPLTRRRPDFFPARPEVSNLRVGWIAFLPAGLSSDATAFILEGDGRTVCPVGTAHIPGNYMTAPAAKAGGIIAGVEASPQGGWVKDQRPPGAAPAPFATETWSAPAADSGPGALRLGPVTAVAGTTIGLPLITGPDASDGRVSVIEHGTRNVIVTATPPAGMSTWDLWRLDIPAGVPAMTVDYEIEHGHTGPGAWMTVGLPRRINP